MKERKNQIKYDNFQNLATSINYKLFIYITEDPQAIAEVLRKKAFRMLGLDGKNVFR